MAEHFLDRTSETQSAPTFDSVWHEIARENSGFGKGLQAEAKLIKGAVSNIVPGIKEAAQHAIENPLSTGMKLAGMVALGYGLGMVSRASLLHTAVRGAFAYALLADGVRPMVRSTSFVWDNRNDMALQYQQKQLGRGLGHLAFDLGLTLPAIGFGVKLARTPTLGIATPGEATGIPARPIDGAPGGGAARVDVPLSPTPPVAEVKAPGSEVRVADAALDPANPPPAGDVRVSSTDANAGQTAVDPVVEASPKPEVTSSVTTDGVSTDGAPQGMSPPRSLHEAILELAKVLKRPAPGAGSVSELKTPDVVPPAEPEVRQPDVVPPPGPEVSQPDVVPPAEPEVRQPDVVPPAEPEVRQPDVVPPPESTGLEPPVQEIDIVVRPLGEPVKPVEQPAPPPAVLEQPAPPPAVVEQPAPPPAVVEQPAPPPAVVEQPASPPAVVEQPAPPPAVVEQPAPPPAVVEQPAPPPAVVEQPAPPPAVVEQPAPPPAAVEQPAPPPAAEVKVDAGNSDYAAVAPEPPPVTEQKTSGGPVESDSSVSDARKTPETKTGESRGPKKLKHQRPSPQETQDDDPYAGLDESTRRAIQEDEANFRQNRGRKPKRDRGGGRHRGGKGSWGDDQ